MLTRALVALIATSLLLTVACDGDDGGDDGTPSAVATGAATPAPTATIAPDAIRDVPLESSEPVVALIEETGGAFAQTNVLYADVTGDGVEEAVVPLASSGTLGYVAFAVLSPDGKGGASALLTAKPEEAGGFNVAVDGGQIIVVEAVRRPDDPECCPGQLRTTTYAWDGTRLAIESQTTAPASQNAKTPGVSP